MQPLSKKLCLLMGEPAHWCPGCRLMHIFNVHAPDQRTRARWTWNGDLHRPTFAPSMRILGQCHYHLHDGLIEFLNDCTHGLAGQTVPLPDLPESHR